LSAQLQSCDEYVPCLRRTEYVDRTLSRKNCSRRLFCYLEEVQKLAPQYVDLRDRSALNFNTIALLVISMLRSCRFGKVSTSDGKPVLRF